jgi:hypothetical protein
MRAKNTHIIKIIERFLAGETISSNDVFASNSNQYFGTIKKNGIALVEVWQNNITNRGRHKERSLYWDKENLLRAGSYLRRLKGIK